MKENVLKKIAKHLKMRFPTSQISKDLNYSQGVISQYLNDKKEISDNFRKDFEKFYNVKFSDFEEENNIISEPETIYETSYDRNIAIAEERIKEFENKLKSKDPDLTPLAIQQIKTIIEGIYKEISIHQEAKNDYLKHNK